MEWAVFILVATQFLLVIRLSTIVKQQKKLSFGWAKVMETIISPVYASDTSRGPNRYPFSYHGELNMHRTVLDQIGQRLEDISFHQEETRDALRQGEISSILFDIRELLQKQEDQISRDSFLQEDIKTILVDIRARLDHQIYRMESMG